MLVVSTFKEAQWQEAEAHFRTVTDLLGMPVDAGILETVIALNLSGFPTSSSCEGHMDRSGYTPMICMEVPEAKDLLRIAAHLAQKLHEEAKNVPLSEHMALYAPYIRLKEQAIQLHMQRMAPLVDLLSNFYRHRQVDYLDQLALFEIGTCQSILAPLGATLQAVRNEGKRAVALKRYQAEFADFTAYLRNLWLRG
jgi:hypothetical protein